MSRHAVFLYSGSPLHQEALALSIPCGLRPRNQWHRGGAWRWSEHQQVAGACVFYGCVFSHVFPSGVIKRGNGQSPKNVSFNVKHQIITVLYDLGVSEKWEKPGIPMK